MARSRKKVQQSARTCGQDQLLIHEHPRPCRNTWLPKSKVLEQRLSILCKHNASSSYLKDVDTRSSTVEAIRSLRHGQYQVSGFSAPKKCFTMLFANRSIA